MSHNRSTAFTKGVKGIVKDQLIVLKGPKHKGMLLRRLEAHVEIEGEERLMVFITNNLSWSPRSVCDLYRRRWDIEVFLKQVKQTLKLSNFLGHSANAVLVFLMLWDGCGRRSQFFPCPSYASAEFHREERRV